MTQYLRRCRLLAGRQGTLSPDTPSQRPKGLWKPVKSLPRKYIHDSNGLPGHGEAGWDHG